jgi:hypothetical protein
MEKMGNIWKKDKLNSEKILKKRKKSRLNCKRNGKYGRNVSSIVN